MQTPATKTTGGNVKNEKVFAKSGFSYCYVLDKAGLWFNQGMVPDANRQPFIAEYKQTKGTRVAFTPFCFRDNNLMSDSQIYSFVNGSL